MYSVEDVKNMISTNGVLVRSVQIKNLASNFSELDVCTRTTSLSYQYGPKRNWSVGHSKLPSIFFKMNDTDLFARYIAIMIDPLTVGWNRYIQFSIKDASTNSKCSQGCECPLLSRKINNKTDKINSEEDIKCLYGEFLQSLINEKERQNTNNEVNTCGFNTKSFVGLLLNDRNNWWKNNRNEVIKQMVMVSKTIDKSDIFPLRIYKYNPDKTTLELELFENIEEPIMIKKHKSDNN